MILLMDSGDEILLYVLSLLSAIIVKIKKKKYLHAHDVSIFVEHFDVKWK